MNSPLVLEGGFDQWKLQYPMFVSGDGDGDSSDDDSDYLSDYSAASGRKQRYSLILFEFSAFTAEFQFHT